jgi:hypothetical protein
MFKEPLIMVKPLGLENKGKEEIKQIMQARACDLRQKGHTFAQISVILGCSLGQGHIWYRQAMAEAAKQREKDHPIFLEQTIQGFDQLEEVILARGRINLEATLRRARLYAAQALEKGVAVNGRTAEEWEIELDGLTGMADFTLGLDNEDIDRLNKIRDRRATFLGVEPPKKLAVEHTIITQAHEAQQRLRAKLGMTPSPQPSAPVEEVFDAEIEDSADESEVREDL